MIQSTVNTRQTNCKSRPTTIVPNFKTSFSLIPFPKVASAVFIFKKHHNRPICTPDYETKGIE